ncbi:cysteine--tRNA ligase [Candidatus Woesearchaeota archaeon]|nr:cysteine--tRNA ligase [Candidatus Woesearchaeota archaeon]
MIQLYNSLTKQKEHFTPLQKGQVRMYSCGPTVYNYAHLGNLMAFCVADVLKRNLRLQGYQVRHVMNITDIDDKTIRDSQAQHITREELTEKYTKAFFEDLDALHIDKADEFPSATAYVDHMIVFIQQLLDKQYAYQGQDNSIYFKVRQFSDYGILGNIDLDALKEGGSGRIKADEYSKENVQDFALWKAWESNDGPNYWEPCFTINKEKKIIKGRPGWHIECSVMSTELLGEQIDIHTGGIDLRFPHHDNEIAQTEAVTGKQFVKYWIHNEHLLVDNKRMSKSAGNFYTLRDITGKGYRPAAFRYLVLSGHYRQQTNFTWNSLEAAQHSIERLQDFVVRMHEITATGNAVLLDEIKAQRQMFLDALANDLNTPVALDAIFDMIKTVYAHIDKISEHDAKEALHVMNDFNSVFAVLCMEQEELPPEIAKLIAQRERARTLKDWALADTLREQLRQQGYEIEDTAQGTRWKRISS